MRCYQHLQSILLVLGVVFIPASSPAQTLQDLLREITSSATVSDTPITLDSQPASEDTPDNQSGQVDSEGLIRGSGQFITVERGDTLFSIAERELGDAGLWRDICDLNQLKNECSAIFAGQKLELPNSAFTPRAEAAAKADVAPDIDILRSENSTLDQNLRSVKKQLAKVIEALKTQRTEFAEREDLLQNEVTSARQLLQQYEAEIADLREENASLQGTILDLEGTLKTLNLRDIANTAEAAETRIATSLRAGILFAEAEGGSTLSVSMNDKVTALQGPDGQPLSPGDWNYLDAFIQPDKIILHRQNPSDGSQGLSVFERSGKFIESTPNLTLSDIEARAIFDINGDGRIGMERTIEDSGLATLLTDAEGYYQVLFENEKFYLLNAKRRRQSPADDYQVLHVEPFEQGFLTLYRSQDQLRTHRYTRTGEFRDTYDIKSYAAFFSTVGTN